MSDLDEVSVKIGQLTGQMEMHNQNMEHLVTWIKESNGRIETALTNHASEDKKDFETLNARVASLDKFKTKVYAVASFCSLLLTAGLDLLFHRSHG